MVVDWSGRWCVIEVEEEEEEEIESCLLTFA